MQRKVDTASRTGSHDRLLLGRMEKRVAALEADVKRISTFMATVP